MPRILLFFACLFFTFCMYAQPGGVGDLARGINRYPVPDTTRGIVFYNEVIMPSGPVLPKAKALYTVAGFSRGSIAFVRNGSATSIRMQINDSTDGSHFTAQGAGVRTAGAGTRTWFYPWKAGVNYKITLSALPDSATRTTIYAGYIFLPEKQQWKLIAAAKCANDGDYLRDLYAATHNQEPPNRLNGADSLRLQNAWLQRRNGTWYEFRSQRPVIDLAKNADSTDQALLDKEAIHAAVRAGKIDTTASSEGVYYHILKQGTGEQVSVTDTVTVFYKGYLLSDGTIFDQTKEQPASFPLKRLIRGWQIAIPMCKVGGTVRVVIPSGLAYGIRARSKDIPPNSVLVFDIDIVSAKRAN